jgi:hypothetical protein
VLLVVGLMAHAGARGALEPDYDSLLDHTVLGDKGLGLSLKGEHTCSGDAQAAPAPATSSGSESPPPSPGEPSEPRPEDLLAPMPSDDAPLEQQRTPDPAPAP